MMVNFKYMEIQAVTGAGYFYNQNANGIGLHVETDSLWNRATFKIIVCTLALEALTQ